MTKDEKALIDEKFNGLEKLLNEKFLNVYDTLEEIKNHVQKTNGRVSRLEDERAARGITCPNLDKIKDIDSKIDQMRTKYEDLNFLIKYPKLFIGGIVVIVLLTLATFLNSTSISFNKINSKQKNEIVNE